MKKINLYKDGEVLAYVIVHPSQLDRTDLWLHRVCSLTSKLGMNYHYSIEDIEEYV